MKIAVSTQDSHSARVCAPVLFQHRVPPYYFNRLVDPSYIVPSLCVPPVTVWGTQMTVFYKFLKFLKFLLRDACPWMSLKFDIAFDWLNSLNRQAVRLSQRWLAGLGPVTNSALLVEWVYGSIESRFNLNVEFISQSMDQDFKRSSSSKYSMYNNKKGHHRTSSIKKL